MRLPPIFELTFSSGRVERIEGWPAACAVFGLAFQSLRQYLSVGRGVYTRRVEGEDVTIRRIRPGRTP